MYLYILEDGSLKQGPQPTTEDSNSVLLGELTVLLFHGGCFYEYHPDIQEEQWQQVERK